MKRAVLCNFVSSNTAMDSGLADSSYVPATREQIFKQRTIHNAMSPHGVKVRESRDSEEHPNSMAIIIALDVTGSMGHVPHALIQDGLPHIMETILAKGVTDPQVLFLAIGDHTCDEAPLQVGQFESSDELLDHWLTDVYLEGHGGGNDGESYMLAWYFAARHTEIDCFEKRAKKGFLFTIGDEPVLGSISQDVLQRLMGDGQFEDVTSKELLEQAREKYNVFHINISETHRGGQNRTVDTWKEIIGDDFLQAQRHTDVAGTIAATILTHYDKDAPAGGPAGEEPIL
jgi:hypothetical protein